MAGNASMTDTTDREIVQQRTFDAPRELVWKAWTTPEAIGRWWGPFGFTTTTESMEFKPGGRWVFTMHGPDGTDWPNLIVYDTIEAPTRLVYDHGETDIDESSPHCFHVEIDFEEAAGGTQVTMRSVFPTKEARDAVVKFGAVEGGRQTLERLGNELDIQDVEPFVVSHTFDAPRELVWRCYTDAEHLQKWWGPKGFEFLHCSLDLRIDFANQNSGLFHYGMSGPNDIVMWGKFVFRAIVPPEFMAYVVSFSDPEGGTTRHLWSETWPLEVLNHQTFTDSDGRTTVTLKGWPINATAEEKATFAAGHSSMQQGFKGTLDQLDAYLAELQG